MAVRTLWLRFTGKIETQKDGVTKKWVVTFESNEDTTHMRYMIGTQTFDGEGLTEEEKIGKWTDILLGEQGMRDHELEDQYGLDCYALLAARGSLYPLRSDGGQPALRR